MIGFEAEMADFVGRGEHRLENDLQRQAFRAVQFLDDLARIRGDLFQHGLAVEMLAAGDVPDFDGIEVLHA